MKWVLLCWIAFGVPAFAQVQSQGVSSNVKLEETVYGHLEELNGKYKFRASEVVIAPGGKLGPHHHAGPGVRYVAAGELTFIEGGKATVYKTGAFFYESGDIVHTAENKTKAPLRIVFFEILPANWSGVSVIAPKPH